MIPLGWAEGDPVNTAFGVVPWFGTQRKSGHSVGAGSGLGAPGPSGAGSLNTKPERSPGCESCAAGRPCPSHHKPQTWTGGRFRSGKTPAPSPYRRAEYGWVVYPDLSALVPKREHGQTEKKTTPPQCNNTALHLKDGCGALYPQDFECQSAKAVILARSGLFAVIKAHVCQNSDSSVDQTGDRRGDKDFGGSNRRAGDAVAGRDIGFDGH